MDENFGGSAGETVGRGAAVAGETAGAAQLAVAVGVHVVAVVAGTVVAVCLLGVDFAGTTLTGIVTGRTGVGASSADSVGEHGESGLAGALAIEEVEVGSLAGETIAGSGARAGVAGVVAEVAAAGRGIENTRDTATTRAV